MRMVKLETKIAAEKRTSDRLVDIQEKEGSTSQQNKTNTLERREQRYTDYQNKINKLSKEYTKIKASTFKINIKELIDDMHLNLDVEDGKFIKDMMDIENKDSKAMIETKNKEELALLQKESLKLKEQEEKQRLKEEKQILQEKVAYYNQLQKEKAVVTEKMEQKKHNVITFCSGTIDEIFKETLEQTHKQHKASDIYIIDISSLKECINEKLINKINNLSPSYIQEERNDKLKGYATEQVKNFVAEYINKKENEINADRAEQYLTKYTGDIKGLFYEYMKIIYEKDNKDNSNCISETNKDFHITKFEKEINENLPNILKEIPYYKDLPIDSIKKFVGSIATEQSTRVINNYIKDTNDYIKKEADNQKLFEEKYGKYIKEQQVEEKADVQIKLNKKIIGNKKKHTQKQILLNNKDDYIKEITNKKFPILYQKK